MEITKQEVEKVAKLARLALTEAETTAFSQQLNQIVAYVQKLEVRCPRRAWSRRRPCRGRVMCFVRTRCRRRCPSSKRWAMRPMRRRSVFGFRKSSKNPKRS